MTDHAPPGVRPDPEDVPGAHTVGAGPTSAGPTAADPAGALPRGADPIRADPIGAGPTGAGFVGAGPTAADPQAELLNRLRRTPGLEALVAEAVATWRAREGTPDDGTPGWRAFSDAFPTFWEFSNRPR